MSLVALVAVVACGEPTSQSGPEDDPAARARELCQDAGQRVAAETAKVTELESAYASDARRVAEWQETRYTHITRGRSNSRWRAVPPDTFTAVCYFNASAVSAPRGPLYPTTDPVTGEETQMPLPPYDQVVVIVAANGETQMYEARRSWMQEGADGPAKAPEGSVEG